MPRFAIGQFEDFVESAQGSVSRLFQEILEVQKAVNDTREQLRLGRRDQVDRARALLAGAGQALDGGFLSSYEAKRAEFAQSLEAEAQALTQIVQEGEAKSEALTVRARELRNELRSLNPELDKQEEALKRRRSELEAEAAELDRKIAARARWFGTITRRKEIRKLGEQLAKADARAREFADALDNVRKEWTTKLSATSAEDARLQEDWSANELRVARLRQDLSLLTTDLPAEAERRALFSLVEGAATAPPTGDSGLDEALATVNELSDRLDEEEAALAAGSEMLGMLKGVGEGLDGFRKALTSVRAEQEAHSELPRLFVELPESAVAFHAAWDELSRYVVDEKQMAAYPGHFVRALRQLLDERLTPQGIERMFGEMGDALTRATDRWGA